MSNNVDAASSVGCNATEKTKMRELAEKLDRDIDEYMDSLAAKKTKQEKKEFNFEEWEKEIDNHPAFMKSLPERGAEGDFPEAIEALQALKYDDDDPPEERALQFKKDGNKQFQYKRYRDATDCYTEGIKLRCSDKELNAVLYANRAASNVRLGNFRSALKDCVLARKFDPAHQKALTRGLDCFLRLNRPENALQWIDNAKQLSVEIENVAELTEKAKEMQKTKLRDARKETFALRKDMADKLKLLKAFKDRNIRIKDVAGLNFEDATTLEWTDFDVTMPQMEKTLRVGFGEDRESLVWPLIFLYPEFNQSDFVQQFSENATFEEEIEAVLEDKPVWDTSGDYVPCNIEVYFESCSFGDVLCRVPLDWTLKKVLANRHYTISKALPVFLVFSNKSDFLNNYLSRFTVKNLEDTIF